MASSHGLRQALRRDMTRAVLSKLRKHLDPSHVCASGGRDSFQVGQTAKARLGHRVQSLRKGHGRQRLLSEKLSNHSSAGGY